MKRVFILFFLLITVPPIARANTAYLSSLLICRDAYIMQCESMSSVPTLTTNDVYHPSNYWDFLFLVTASYPPIDALTWTMTATLRWEGNSVSRTFSFNPNSFTGFEMGIPDSFTFENLILVTLDGLIFDEAGNLQESSVGENRFYFIHEDPQPPIPEPSAVVLLATGLFLGRFCRTFGMLKSDSEPVQQTGKLGRSRAAAR